MMTHKKCFVCMLCTFYAYYTCDLKASSLELHNSDLLDPSSGSEPSWI